MKVTTFELARVAVSKQGHDKGRAFAVVGLVDEKHVLIADGDTRKLEKPKKKQTKHLQAKPAVLSGIADALEKGRPLTDSDLRKALKAATDREVPTKEECAFVQE